MKNLFLISALFCSTLLFAQKSETYLKISYNSICCGTPSHVPVMNYIEDFQKKNKGKTIEIFQQSGLGREGEFRLFVGSDALSKRKKRCFVKGLQNVVNNQNKNRDKNRNGIVDFNSSETISKEKLLTTRNLTVYKKENLK